MHACLRLLTSRETALGSGVHGQLRKADEGWLFHRLVIIEPGLGDRRAIGLVPGCIGLGNGYVDTQSRAEQSAYHLNAYSDSDSLSM